MQTFLASDVLYEARTAPLIKEALEDAEIGGQTIAALALPARDRVAERADRRGPARPDAQRSGEGARRSDARAGPARHRARVVSIGDTTLQPDAPNRVTAGADTPIVVKFTNQGENDEFDVKVTVTVEGGDKPIKASRTVDTIAKGQTAEASLTLGKAPPVGAAVTVKATVAKVPGEQKTDNNTAEYDVLFTAG